jgi:2-polyprenyl-3-methyl-5-hydroxy-6-metoxy-1,4-benzoquinol methylase
VEPFELAELHRLPRGRLIDVGCGNGLLLRLAQQLGWRATGLEIDPAAVKVAQSRGLDVLEGSYERLEEFHGSLDAIICSHVLEHVHDPQDMLLRLAGALKSGGTLLLSLPNATSLLREKFGNDWRGLEAPRHLTIPSMRQLQAHLQQLGFTARQREFTLPWTAAESSRIRRRDTRLTTEDRSVQQSLTRSRVFSNIQQYDFIELICIKDVSR